MKPVILVLIASTALAGCTTHLEVSQAGSSVASRTGFAYPLQFTQYEVKITRRIADCEDDGLPRVDIKVEAVPGTVDDGDHIYVISPGSLISPTKISDLQIAWEEGRLKSLNASAEDRTGQIVLGIAQGIGKLAASSLVGGVGTSPSDPKCNQATRDNVELAKIKTGEIKKLTEQVTAAKLEIAQLEARLAKDTKDGKTRKRVRTLADNLETAEKALAATQKALNPALEALTDVSTIRWPESGRKFVSDPQVLSRATMERWIEVPLLSGEQPDAYDTRWKGIGSRFNIFLRIERVGTYGRDPVNVGAESADSAGSRAGLRYRLPASGRLVACKKVLCSSTETEKVILASVGPVQQLGQIFYVPFSSPVFSNASMNISFDNLGRPVAAGVKRPTASAETAANAFRDVAGEAAGIADKLYKTPTERLSQDVAIAKLRYDLREAEEKGMTPLDVVKREADLARAQVDLAKAQRDLQVDPTLDLKRQTDLLIAQKAYNDASRGLPDPNAATTAATAGFTADALLLQAEKSRIEAQIARDEALKKLNPQ